MNQRKFDTLCGMVDKMLQDFSRNEKMAFFLTVAPFDPQSELGVYQDSNANPVLVIAWLEECAHQIEQSLNDKDKKALNAHRKGLFKREVEH